MFFYVSKIAWFVLQPLVAITLLLCLGLVLSLIGFRRAGILSSVLGGLLLAVCALTPAGLVMTAALENRFPRPELPAKVDGIVVLGGSFDTRVAKSRGEPELNEAADRMTEAMALARRYPQAKVLFSGGLAAILEDDVPEVDSARDFFAAQGLAPDRLLLEGEARNTAENAEYARVLADPQPGETWLLVTSASHMPRSVGCFRVAGFDVLPYPTDYRTPLGASLYRPSSATTRNLEKVHFATREYIGLVAYWLTGRTDALFPAPSAPSSPAVDAATSIGAAAPSL
ncbi:MAG: YdcF family protein [Rhizobiaceae bacterium]|nr:YdcF family protein [Rhizobiaceae bacterium]